MRCVCLQIGPGVVYLMFESMFGRGVFVQSLTPVEPLMQKLVHNIYVSWTMPIPVAKFYMLGEALQVGQCVFAGGGIFSCKQNFDFI